MKCSIFLISEIYAREHIRKSADLSTLHHSRGMKIHKRAWVIVVQGMYMSLRARLLRRRRLRMFLVQARRRVYAICEKLVAFCPCCIRSIQQAPAMVVTSAADSASGSPVAQPIESLAELSDRTLLLSPQFEFLKSSVPLTVNVQPKRPQLLVCHDYKGGYQEDKWVQGKEGMEGYVLWHWHLVDMFVYFSHSLVTIPPPGWINAAHKHGVPVRPMHGSSQLISIAAMWNEQR